MLRRSAKRGRMPVASNRPSTRPRHRRRDGEAEDLLHGDDLAFHAGDLLQADDAAPAVAHALELEHDLDRGRDLRASSAEESRRPSS